MMLPPLLSLIMSAILLAASSNSFGSSTRPGRSEPADQSGPVLSPSQSHAGHAQRFITREPLHTEIIARRIESWIELQLAQEVSPSLNEPAAAIHGPGKNVHSGRSEFSLEINQDGLKLLRQLSSLLRWALDSSWQLRSPAPVPPQDQLDQVQADAVSTYQNLLLSSDPKARIVLNSVMESFVFDLNNRFNMQISMSELLPSVDTGQIATTPLKQEGLAKLAGLKMHLALPRVLRELGQKRHKVGCSDLAFQSAINHLQL